MGMVTHKCRYRGVTKYKKYPPKKTATFRFYRDEEAIDHYKTYCGIVELQKYNGYNELWEKIWTPDWKPKTSERRGAMHKSRNAFLLKDPPMCVLAAYDANKGADTEEFKTFDRAIQVDDYIVIPTNRRHHMTIVQVKEVDFEPDLESDLEVMWVIAKVDKTQYETTLESEKGFVQAARSAQRKRKRDQLAEDLLADVDANLLVIEHNGEARAY